MRAQQLKANGGSFSAREWYDLWMKYDRRCAACGLVKDVIPDHVVPVSKGGTSDISNIQPLCIPCNSSKGTRIIDYRQ